MEGEQNGNGRRNQDGNVKRQRDENVGFTFVDNSAGTRFIKYAKVVRHIRKESRQKILHLEESNSEYFKTQRKSETEGERVWNKNTSIIANCLTSTEPIIIKLNNTAHSKNFLYSIDGLSPTIKSDVIRILSHVSQKNNLNKGGNNLTQIKNKKTEINVIGSLNIVATKRIHETPKEINIFLKKNKGEKTIKEISNLLNIPITQVEHYFRCDSSRSIPSPKIWVKLKNILKFSDEFDTIVCDVYNKMVEFEQSRRVYGSDGISPTLNATNEHMIKQLNNPVHSNNRVYAIDGLSPCITTPTGGNRQPFIMDLYNNKEHKDRTPTLTDPCYNNIRLREDSKIRKLTPTEYERLQAFSVGWTKYGIDELGNEVEMSDTQRYMALGNAVTTNVIYEIAKTLK